MEATGFSNEGVESVALDHMRCGYLLATSLLQLVYPLTPRQHVRQPHGAGY